MPGSVEDEPTPSGKAYEADGVTVWFDLARCRHFAECVRGLPEVFEPGRRPWVRPELGEPSEIARVIRRCPSGALHYRLADGPAEEPATPTRIRRMPEGPLLVKGDLLVHTRAGDIRETRAALCGCGGSKSAPFCDGACDVNRPLGPRD
jgi:uncharacterized Fe-S cluster protein YjdI/CDGSH-type Zn-finger protein